MRVDRDIVSGEFGRTDSAGAFLRVIDAFVNRLDMQKLGFIRAEAAGDGATGIRSARSVEAVSLWLSTADSFFATFGE